MDQEKRTWSRTIDLLRTQYTMSIRDVCQMLKSSRNWVNRYIRPHVRTIYLNSNIRSGSNVPLKVNWVQAASIELEKEMNESTWLHAKDVLDLLQHSITSVTKQTKFVPVAALMRADVADAYIKEYAKAEAELRKIKDIVSRMHASIELSELHLKYLNEPAKELVGKPCSITKRGDIARVDVEYPGEFDPTKWVAAHDIKDYGDTDEDVYRKFFREGAIRIELSVPDENGEIGSKVFYIPDPEPLPFRDGRKVVVPEAAWQKYKARL